MKKIKIGIIGYGNRGRLYTSFLKDMLDEVELIAVCDFRIENFQDELKKDMNVQYFYSNTEDFFAANLDLDLVIVASMDQYHYQNTLDCLNHNYNVSLEKPIAQTLEQVLTLNRIAKEKNLKVIVSYVLRYTLFYREIKKIIDSGEIGDIININTTENVAYWHQAHSFVRGNWRNSKETTPMILAKCSHDLDLIYWLMNKTPKYITSFGNLSYLKKENAPKDSAKYCYDCKLKENCAWNAYKFYLNNRAWLVPMLGVENPTDEQIDNYIRHGQYGRCVFKCDNNVVDHQILNVEFEDKATASHTMNAFTRYCYRDIKVMGTKGQIEGNFEEKKFKVFDFLDNKERVIDIAKMTDDFVGHGGGDRIMMKELIHYLKTGEKSFTLTTLEESVVSHVLCYAAEDSRLHHGKVIKLNMEDSNEKE